MFSFFQNSNTLTLDPLDLHAAVNIAQVSESLQVEEEVEATVTATAATGPAGAIPAKVHFRHA